MSRRQAGLGMLETLLALAIALVLLAAGGQLLVSLHQAWTQQGAAARLQDDARFALQRIAEDVRMAGMFGCLRLEAADFHSPAAAEAFAQPLRITPDSLTLVGAVLPGLLGPADWTVLTDCRDWAQVQPGQHVAGEQLLALPVRRLSYQLRNGSLLLTTASQRAALIDNVSHWRVTLAAEGDRLDIELTVSDPDHRLEQRHRLSIALRNLVGEA